MEDLGKINTLVDRAAVRNWPDKAERQQQDQAGERRNQRRQKPSDYTQTASDKAIHEDLHSKDRVQKLSRSKQHVDNRGISMQTLREHLGGIITLWSIDSR